MKSKLVPADSLKVPFYFRYPSCSQVRMAVGICGGCVWYVMRCKELDAGFVMQKTVLESFVEHLPYCDSLDWVPPATAMELTSRLLEACRSRVNSKPLPTHVDVFLDVQRIYEALEREQAE